VEEALLGNGIGTGTGTGNTKGITGMLLYELHSYLVLLLNYSDCSFAC
jgi:hypothetical protein